MITIEDRLAALLLSRPAIKSMVGTNVDWGRAPQGLTGKRIVMFVVSSVTGYRMNGPVKHYMTRVQIDCRGDTDQEARALANAVDAFLSGFKGNFAELYIDGVFRDGHRSASEHDALTWNTPSRWYARQIDYRIFWAPAQG